MFLIRLLIWGTVVATSGKVDAVMPWTLDTMKVDAASLMSGKGLGNCRCVMQCSWHGIVFQQCAVKGNVIRSMSHALG